MGDRGRGPVSPQDVGFRADAAGVYSFLASFFEGLCTAKIAGACVSPGSRSTPLAIAAQRTVELPLRVHIDERSAAFFALGWAKAARAPVALICTSGTAAANYLPAIVEAHHSGVPLIVLTADRPPELRAWGAGQTIDQAGLYAAFARFAAEAPVPVAGEDGLRFAARLAARTVAEATGARPGPVHVNWPLREPLPPPPRAANQLADRSSRHRPVSVSTGRARPARRDVEALAALVTRGVRGVIACGPMDESPEFAETLSSLAMFAGWPILADPTSQLRRGSHVARAPVLGAAEALLRDVDFAAAHRPECLLRFGATPVSKALRRWTLESEPDDLWWIDDASVEWSDPDHLATRVVRCDPAQLIGEVLTELSARGQLDAPGGGRSRWLEDFVSANGRALDKQARLLQGEAGLLEAGVVRELGAAMPNNSILYVSNSMPVRHLDAFLEASETSLRVLSNRGASGIDGLNSCALGAAEARLGPVVLLTGDLAFLHDIGGLLAARGAPPVVFIVLNNDGGDIFSHLPIAEQGERVGFETFFRTPHGLSFASAAELHDLAYESISGAEHLRTAIKSALSRETSTILEVPIDAERSRRQYQDLVG